MEKHHLIAVFALVLTLGGMGLFAHADPIVPDSRPDRDEIVTLCEGGAYGVYAHAWHEQKVMIFGRVYKDGKHDSADVILTWKGKNTPDTLWYRGVQMPDAVKWLKETDLCDATAAATKP